MGHGDDPSSNIFVRFKHHVDANVSLAVNSVLGSQASQASQAEAKNRKEPSTDSSTSAINTEPTLISSEPKPQPNNAPYSNTMDSDDMNIVGREKHDSLSSVAFSSYSPVALRSLPQPVPSDAPSDIDGKIFKFEDAFEDLLAVSKGQELPDIRTKYGQRKLLNFMYPDGEPAWFWIRRLKTQGLINEPMRSSFFGVSNGPDWGSFHQELDRRAAEAWKSASGELHDEMNEGGLFGDVRNMLRRIDDGFRGSENPSPDSTVEEIPRHGREPDHFDELFNSIRSTFAEGQKTWDTFVKTITDIPPNTHRRLDAIEEHRDQNATNKRNEKNQIVNKDEFVDRFGYLHSKITIKTFDDDGNEIGSETRVTVRPADKTLDKSNNGEMTKALTDGRDDVGKLGWFWK